ncbi:putative ribonuclease H-like domain-containing protein [Tanacetum coccineum]
MCSYLKNMEGKKPKDLKNKSFDSIQKMFNKAFKRVNTFVDFRTDLVEGSSKRAGEELEQEIHSLRMQHVYIHMLVEKRYPLKPSTITDMLNRKLQLSMKKLEILKKNIKFRGGLLGLKGFLMILELLPLSRVNHKNFANRMNHPHPNRRFVPQAVLTKSGKINNADASVNTAVRPVNTAGSKTTVSHPRPISNAYKKGYSQVTKPFNKCNPQQKEYKEIKKGVIDMIASGTRLETMLSCEYEDDDGWFWFSLEMVKGIKREFNVARTHQQNGIAERRNRTLIEVARTMDHLGKFDGKADQGFFVGYSVVSKAMRENKLMVLQEIEIALITGQAKKRTEPEQEYILIPFYTTDPLISQGPKDSKEDSRMKPTEEDVSGALDKDREDDQAIRSDTHVSAAIPYFTNDDPSSPVNAAEASNAFEEHLFERFSPFKNVFTLPLVSNVTPMDDTGIFGNAYNDDDVGADADLNNLGTTVNVSPIPTTRIDKDHPKDQIIGDFNSAIQTRRMTKISDEHAMVCYINKQRRTNNKDYQNCLFAYFLSQMEPKKVIQALEDPSWIEAMQEELLQFQLQKVWTLVNLPNGKRAIGTNWVFRNKKNERGIVVRNKARLMDVKSAFLYGTIEEDVAWYETLSTYLIENGFRRGTIDKTLFIKKDKGDILLVQMSSMGELTFFLGLQVQQKKDEIFISQDKYVAEILKKFDFATVKTASTPMEPNKALVKDEEAEAVDVHYRSMIGSLIDSTFNLEAFSDSDYAGVSLDRKSATGGCQFLSKRLISWQYKKQTIVANSTTEVEYVAAANCCGLVLWFKIKCLIWVQLLEHQEFLFDMKAPSISDNTHRSFVWGKAVWNYVYKYSRLYIMDA